MPLYTLTPNPALDLSGLVADLVPNEKNYVSDERRDPGGNGINAARIATRLGTPCVALGFIGGSTGAEIEELLKKEKVKTAFLPIRGHTRVNVTVCNESTALQTRLTFPGPKVSAAEVNALRARVEKLKGPGLFVLGGSLPPGTPRSFYFDMARAASRAGLGVVIDVPAKVMGGILARSTRSQLKPLLMKPNQTELEEWVGRKLGSDREIAQAARELARSVSLVCVSLADRGAILATSERAWFGVAPKVEARGTVGAGDSMVGAISGRLLKSGLTTSERMEALLKKTGEHLPKELEEALCWGLAAGAATAEVSGTQLARPAEIRRLVRQVSVRPL